MEKEIVTPQRQKKRDTTGGKSVTAQEKKTVTRQAKNNSQIVLSIFPGIDLLGKAFQEAGFCVVTGPDLIYGGDIRSFSVPSFCFDGVIGGSPCQEFSQLHRGEKTGYSIEMLGEYERIVSEAKPNWYLLENVVGVPDLRVKGYFCQRFNLDAGWFSDYSRLRAFQFGNLKNQLLNPPVTPLSKRPLKGGAALATDDRTFRKLCDAQGLPNTFDLPSFNVAGKKRAVGNGVPMPLGRVLANMVKNVTNRLQNKTVTAPGIKCACGCGRDVLGRKKTSSDACRKRLSRGAL